MVKCTKCGNEIDELAVFPGGICVECYAKTPEANAPLTAEDVAAMWGGAVLAVETGEGVAEALDKIVRP